MPILSPKLEALQHAIAYQFNNPDLLLQALSHRSTGAKNNERLEFLGDSILNFCITERLYELRPDADEGQLSRIRASLVNGESLADIAEHLELAEVIRLGVGEKRSGGKRRRSILADAVEALFGAVLLDSDFVRCRDLILQLYAVQLSDLPDAEDLKDPKTRLQELLQGRGKPLPSYTVLSESGKDHQKVFSVACQVEGIEAITANGTSRRKAEQQAAALMYQQLTHAG